MPKIVKYKDLSEKEQLEMLKAVQYALDGLWKDPDEMVAATGILRSEKEVIFNHVENFLSVRLES